VCGLWFTTHELQALLIIRQMLQQLQPSLLSDYFDSLAEHVDKLLAATGKLPSHIAKRINVIPIAHQYIASEIFLALCQATLHHQSVVIQYQDIEGHYSERILSPQRIVYYKNNWYVDAWCHKRQDLRTFWMAGIQSIEKTEQAAHSVTEEILASHFESSYGIFSGTPLHTAHLRFTGRAAMRTRGSEWHPQQQQKNNPDGSVELWIPYSDPRELILDIMHYGCEVEVIAPTILKEEVIHQFKRALAIYQNHNQKKQEEQEK
jgi:predicted DNA-binding transcriptional regulator YafY